MARLSYFVAPLCCPACGEVSRAEIETRLLDADDVRELAVGDRADIGIEAVRARFHTLREPAGGEPLRLLDNWVCEHCSALNWAIVELRYGMVSAIENVTLAEGLERAHFIPKRLDEPFERVTGEAYRVDGLPRPDWLEVLRAAANLSRDPSRAQDRDEGDDRKSSDNPHSG